MTYFSNVGLLGIGFNKDERFITGAPCLVKSVPKKSSISLTEPQSCSFVRLGRKRMIRTVCCFSPCDTLARSQFGKTIEPSTQERRRLRLGLMRRFNVRNAAGFPSVHRLPRYSESRFDNAFPGKQTGKVRDIATRRIQGPAKGFNSHLRDNKRVSSPRRLAARSGAAPTMKCDRLAC